MAARTPGSSEAGAGACAAVSRVKRNARQGSMRVVTPGGGLALRQTRVAASL